MIYAFRRLALGILLIALASAILLIADRDRIAPAGRRTLRLAILQHADSAIMEDGVRGMLDGLSERGYRAGENGVTIERFNAQNDMPTGVYLLGAYAEMLPFIKAVRPGARVFGTIYVPAEINMVTQLDQLKKIASAAGLEIKAVAANSPAEVGDAAVALIANGVDVICQIPGNLTASAFPSIAQAANRARTPVFVFQSSQVRAGAVLGISRDHYDSGHKAAAIAARIMRGESPKDIPFEAFGGTKLLV